MNDHENLQLREPQVTPTRELLEQILGDSYAAYETFQDALPGLEMEQESMVYSLQGLVCKRTTLLGNAERSQEREKPLLAICL